MAKGDHAFRGEPSGSKLSGYIRARIQIGFDDETRKIVAAQASRNGRSFTAEARELVAVGLKTRQLRELVAIQADDAALWAPAARIDTAYTQQALRYLTRAIEGEWTFEQARDSIREMMP